MEGGPRQACTVADHHPSLEVNFIHVSHGNNGNEKAVGVVLFQLGGPDSLEAVEPFLFNLFSDPDIIDFPFVRLARPVLARLVASRRARKVQEHYARIGGKSPIRELTERQATALERELRKRLDARVFVAMRYWRPLTEEAIQAVEAHTFRQLILLPLYPQYSKTTTGSSLNEWHRQYATARNPTPTKTIREFYDHPLYLQAVVEKMNQGLERFLPLPSSPGLSDVHLVFSAHGLPISVIEAGDPYRTQVEATAKLVMECGGWSNPHEVCYQSRVSPGRWLEPTLHTTLRRLAAQHAERILVIPISFVTDHVETLYEIDIEAREEARHAGIRQFEVMPALNDSPKFIQALAELVRREVGAQSPPSLVEVTSLRTAL
jgi:ferrochelatase